MEIKDITKEYPNDDIKILWKPKLCIHSEKCWRGLPEVFRYGKKPWVDPQGAETDEIKKQIDQCPSGALSYLLKNEKNEESAIAPTKINIAENGPLLVKGDVEINLPNGEIRKEKSVALCRCGSSNNKPFCDSSHTKINFKAD